MRLKSAASPPLAGPLVPRGRWEASAVGVFQGAIALAHPDGLWITVLKSREDLEPRGVWPGEAVFSALAGLVVLDAPVVFSGEPNHGIEAGGLVFPLDRLEDWDPRADIEEAAGIFRTAGPAVLDRAADRVAAALRKDGYSEGLHGEGPFALRFRRLRGEPAFPFSLIGFGPGTTPGGDDFLAGWLLGRVLAGEGGAAFGAAAGADLSRTTVPGRTLLAGAFGGLFPAYLVRTARALADAAEDPARSAGAEASILSAFRHGASSGRDALLGLAEGMRGPPRKAPAPGGAKE